MSTSTASAPDRLRSRVAAVSLAACEVVEEMIAHRAEVRTVSGLSVDVWLTCHSHLTRTERRAFQVAASALPTLPRVRAAFASGRLSWHLVQAITRAATRLTPDQRDILDGRLAIAMSKFAEADPTVLLDVLQAAMDDLRADLLRDAERRAERGEHLHVQPSLDGMGGSFSGWLGAVNFAAFMETLDAATTLPSLEANPHGDPRITWDNQTALAGARAEAFVKVVTSSGGGQARPKLIATVELETLLDLNRRSARILTTLIGGELRVTAATARRLADDAAGCSFRLVVTNDGQAIGHRRRPPATVRPRLAPRRGPRLLPTMLTTGLQPARTTGRHRPRPCVGRRRPDGLPESSPTVPQPPHPQGPLAGDRPRRWHHALGQSLHRRSPHQPVLGPDPSDRRRPRPKTRLIRHPDHGRGVPHACVRCGRG